MPYASDVIGLLERGRRAAVEAAGDGRRRTLRVSAVTSAGEHLAPLLIQAFRHHHPELDVSLDVGNRTRVPPARRPRGRRGHRRAGPGRRRLTGEPFAPKRDRARRAPPTTRSSGAAGSRRRSSRTRPWLLREPGSGTRVLCEEYLAAHGLHPEISRSARTARPSRRPASDSASRRSSRQHRARNSSTVCSA